MFKRFSIKQLLLLAFLLAGLLPAMVVSFFSFYQAREALKKEISHDMQTLSIAVVNQIDALITERVKDAASWSKLAIMQELQIGDVDKRLSIFLSELKASYGDAFLAIHVVNLQGNIVASSEPNRLNQAYKQQHWFTKNSQNEMVDFAKINKQVFAFNIAIYAQNASQKEPKIGSLVAEFNWQKIQDLLDATLQKPISAAIFNGNQILSASSHWRGQNEHVLHVEQAFPKQSITPNWQLRLEKSHSVAVAPVHRLGYVFLGLLISTLLLATLLVTPIARAITQPLAKLTEFVKNVAPANTSQAIYLDSAPLEAQALSNAFNQLLADLAKSQANLTRAAKLAVVGEMAAAMSHEVRTPLGILRSSADLLLREPKLSKQGKEVLGFVISETERLNKLVSDLIDAARPKLPNFKPVDISQIIQHCIALLQAGAKAKSITVNFDGTELLMLDVDSDQMTQVMMNLLQNAIQILPNNGVVNIHAQQISDDLLITMEDNGAGIAAENQAQIFEPFFTQRAGGVGLGLAVVRQIVEVHRGKIVYETSPLGGAKFSITLPKTTH